MAKASSNGKMIWTIVATIVGIVVAMGGGAWALIENHDDDVAEVKATIEKARTESRKSVEKARTESRDNLEKAMAKVVSEERFTAEMRGVQFQITTLQTQQSANKVDLDKRLDRIDQAVRASRRRNR